MPIRISGLASGLDTEAIVQQLVSAYSYKKDTFVKAQTKLSWKQDLWKNLNKKVRSFYDNLSAMKYSSAYTTKTAVVSNATKANVTASGTAVNGSYSLKVNQMAKAGYLTGGRLAAETKDSTTLGELMGDDAFGGGSVRVVSGGKTTEIAVNKDMTVKDFVAKLNETGVKASYDSANQRIYVAAKDTGAANDFTLMGSDANGTAALKALGLSTGSTANTAEYEKWTNYAVYDALGNYDATATKANIEAVLQSLGDAKTAVADANDSMTQSKSNIINYNNQIKYASSYETMMNAYKNLDTEEEKKDLDTLAEMSAQDLKKTYALDADGNLKRDADGKLVEADDTTPESERATGKEVLDNLAAKAGLVEKKTEVAEGEEAPAEVTIAEFAAARKTVTAYDAESDNDVLVESERDEMKAFISKVQDAYNGTAGAEYASIEELNTALSEQVKTENANIADQNKIIADNQKVIKQHALLNNGEDADALTARITYADEMLTKIANNDASLFSAGATRVNGQDSVIELNGAEYTSTSNTYKINGLTIEALGETGGEELSVTVRTDTDAIYKKVKDFMKQYNELINEMTSLFNADSAKGCEPLTTEEKDAMTDTEVEEWEKKVKDALLRRDDTLGGLQSVMTNTMLKSFEINGKKYSLASFGIMTQGILSATKNEENAFHIAGDPDDSVSSSKKDKLKGMIEDDPDTVTEFFKQLSTSLFDELDSRMKSTKLSSAFNVYNDKQLDQEYRDYTSTIKKWEEKITKMEDTYYRQFAAMEKALATLQSQTSALGGFMGQ